MKLLFFVLLIWLDLKKEDQLNSFFYLVLYEKEGCCQNLQALTLNATVVMNSMAADLIKLVEKIEVTTKLAVIIAKINLMQMD